MIWRSEGRGPGPHLMVLGGVHGNELTGIRAVRWLLRRFGRGGERIACGTLTVALGNPKAIGLGMRGSAPHQDLNRSFVPEKIAAPAIYEEARAAVLAPIIAAADVLVDLHAVNTPSEPFVVATAYDPRRARLAAAFPCRKYVVAPDAIIPGSTDGWIERAGGVGIGYESGHMADLGRMKEVRSGVDGIVRDLGLLPGGGASADRMQAVIRIEEPLMLDGETFTYAPGKGRTGFEAVTKGETLGHLDGKPVRASFSGLLLFPKPKRLHKTGSPVGFLASEG